MLLLPLYTAIASLGVLVSPTCAFRAASSARQILSPKCHDNCAPGRRRHTFTTTTVLHLSSEEEMMNRALMEDQFRQGIIPRGGSEEQKMMSPTTTRAPPTNARMDPLIASLTRDDSDSANVPTRQVPLFGDVPADGNLALLVPAAAIAILGFLLSIVVAFNSRDTIVQTLSSVELPKMEYIPTVIEEGKCRGLCSSQEEDLDGLRNFMESISKKD